MPELHQLNESQREAALHKNGPCCVVAGAGSGKTAMLITRVKCLVNSGVQPNRILCSTFTKKAKDEMKERIMKELGKHRGERVEVVTLHALCRNVLLPILKDGWQLITDNTSLLELAIAPKSEYNPHGTGHKVDVNEASLQIGFAKNSFKKPKDLEDVFIREVYEAYENIKKGRRLLDFDDLLLRTALLFEKNAKIKHHWQAKWDYIMVDEFQDTNSVQWDIVKKLTEKHKNLFCVGDPRQSIYKFRGSNCNLILSFPNHFSKAKVIYLDINYRCSEMIIKAANDVAQHMEFKVNGGIVPHRKGGEPVVILTVEDEIEEAEQIAQIIQMMKHQSHSNYSDFAILYRTNQQTRALEDALSGYEIPYVIVGDKTFYETTKIQVLLSYMQIIQAFQKGKAPEMDWIRKVINKPNRHITRNSVEKLYEEGKHVLLEDPEFEGFMETLEQLLPIQKPSLFLSRLVEIHPSLIQSKDSNQEIAGWFDSLLHSANKYRSLEEYLLHVDWVIRKAKEPKQDAVNLMTIHKSKGLEFNTVFVIDMVEGMLPFQKSIDENDVSEELRLCYVAYTRAKDRLILFYTKQYGEKMKLPSRYLTCLQKGEHVVWK